MVIIKSIQDLKVAIKISWLVACLILLTGCAMDMYDQPATSRWKSDLAGNALSAGLILPIPWTQPAQT